jgi:hypothetical protein
MNKTIRIMVLGLLGLTMVPVQAFDWDVDRDVMAVLGGGFMSFVFAHMAITEGLSSLALKHAGMSALFAASTLVFGRVAVKSNSSRKNLRKNVVMEEPDRSGF